MTSRLTYCFFIWTFFVKFNISISVRYRRKVNVNCKDTGGSGCSQSKCSETFSTDGKKDAITIRDVAGNTTVSYTHLDVYKRQRECR